MIQQRSQLRHRDRHIRLQRVPAKEIIKQTAHRAFLVRRSRHMARGAESVFPLFHIGEECTGKRRGDGIKVLTGILLDTGGDIVCHPKGILKKPQRHTHFLRADIHRRMRINKGIQRKIFIKLIDIATQLEVVFIPVEDNAANTRIMFDKFQ